MKSMYTNKCAVKIGKKHTHIFPHGVRQGCSLSSTLFNIYVNDLARALEQSAAPGLTLLESEVKCLLFADDLVLLSPTKGGPTAAPRSSAHILSDLGPDSKSQ